MATVDPQQQAMQYMQYLQQGMPNAQAFKLAYPNGIQTKQQQLQSQAGAQQGQAYGQVGGMLVGALGAKYALKEIPKLFGKDAVETTAGKVAVTPATSAAQTVVPQLPTNSLAGTTSGIGPVSDGGQYGQSLMDAQSAQADQMATQLTGVSASGNSLNAALGANGVSGIGPVADAGQYATSVSGMSGIGPVADGGQYAANLGGESGGTLGAETLGAAAPYLGAAGAAAGAYGMYQGFKDHSGIETGLGGVGLGLGLNTLGVALGPWGWGALGAMALASQFSGGKKSDQQIARDKMRTGLQQAGIADKNYNVSLPTGSFNIGMDGHHTFQSADGSSHRPYELDMSNPLAVSTIPALHDYVMHLNPNADDTQQKQTIGMLSNAVMNGANNPQDIQNNIAALYSKANMQAPQINFQAPPAVQQQQGMQNQQPQLPQGSPAFQKAQINQNGQFGNSLINALK